MLSPEIYIQESDGRNKMYPVKENIPPKAMDNNFFSQNELPDGLQHLIKATPKKCKELVEEPLTPNTNIKLLTSLAAARDYANCATPKSRKQPENFSTEDYQVPNQKVNGVKPTRKEKSLSIICTRFLALHPLYPATEQKCIISLDEACSKLGIERRRLYDIVNVFESINMLNKLSKNKYMWFGQNKLMHSLHSIKAAAEKENILAKLQYVLDLEESKPESKQSCILDEVADFSKQLESKNKSSFSSETHEYCNFPEMRKEKSLAFMSQRFLMLFLVSPSKIISLGVAAKVLNGFQRNDGGAQMKTHIRRLYDIANVLSSIGLIKKEVTINQNGRKPAFKYIGPSLEDPFIDRHPIPVSTPKKMNKTSRSLTRHSSFQEICNVAEIERRKLCFDETPNSAPPFETNLLIKNEPCSTSFSNLDFNTRLGGPKPEHEGEYREVKKEMPLQTVDPFLQVKNYTEENNETHTQKRPLQNVSLNSLPEIKKETEVIEKPNLVPLQSNVTMINVPKEIFTGNSSCYILSPVTYECLKDTKQIGTFVLFSPGSSYKPMVEGNTSKNKSKEIHGPQNYSLKSSIGVSQPKNISQLVSAEHNLQHSLCQKLLTFTEKPDENASSNVQIKPNKEIASNIESNDSSSVCSTRNNSPTSSISRFDSPFSIPSGYVTPVPNISSDISFPSCVETSSILKNIENCTDLSVKSENMSFSSVAEEKSVMGYLTNNTIVGENTSVLKSLIPNTPDIRDQNRRNRILSSCNSNFPLKEIQNFSMLNNSCSNDSLNSEVSEILKGKKLGESTKKHLLIDENTVLSPIKRIKKEVFPTNSTPSSFITPVPEEVFIFKTANYQSTSINSISHRRPLRIKDTANKSNVFTS